MTSADLVADLERSLLTRLVRTDRNRLERLLHPDFVEVGASGRRWTRTELIESLSSERLADDIEAFDVSAHSLTAGVVLVTYTTRRDAARVHRSSLWVRREGRWQVRFHQATPSQASTNDVETGT